MFGSKTKWKFIWRRHQTIVENNKVSIFFVNWWAKLPPLSFSNCVISGKKSFVKYLFSELCGINWIQGPPLGSPVIELHHLLFRGAWEGNVQNALLLSRLIRFTDPPYRRLVRGTWLYQSSWIGMLCENLDFFLKPQVSCPEQQRDISTLRIWHPKGRRPLKST